MFQLFSDHHMLFDLNNKNCGVGECFSGLFHSREECNSFFNISRNRDQNVSVLPSRLWYSLNITKFPEVSTILFQNSSWISDFETEAGVVENVVETQVCISSLSVYKLLLGKYA